MAHVSDYKKKEVERIANVIKKSDKIGILDLTSLPSAQFQKIKHKLKDKLQVTVTKKSLLKLAIEKAKKEKPGIDILEKELEECMPALLVTNEDAFRIAKLLNQNKSNMGAKPGQVSPRDIIIPEGPTSFTPGPIIGELGQAGIVASVENGKIVVKKESILARKGDVLTSKQTSVLDKFGIEPMEIGLNLKAMYQNGEIFKSDVLFISEEEYINNLKNYVKEALNLAVFVAYPTKETTPILLQKAEREALVLDTITQTETQIDEKKEEVEGQVEEELKLDEKEQDIPIKANEEKIEEIAEEEAEKEMEIGEAKPKDPTGYSEEKSKQAQDILNKLIDEEVKK